jgi:hypothetical protein
MANLTPQDSFDNVYQWEQTDAVLGGSGNMMNRPTQQLLNRTEWLNNRLGINTRFGGVVTFSTNGDTIDYNVIGKLIIADAIAGNKTFYLDSLGNWADNTVLTICCISSSYSVSISANQSTSDRIWWGSQDRGVMYMHDGEYMTLVKVSGKFIVVDCSASMSETGDSISGYQPRRGTIIKQGQTVLRADYPRLWEFVQNLGGYSSFVAVTDAVWLGSVNITDASGATVTIYPNKGFFSLGDGSTTFRLPDERGMFDRYADLSRGIDLNRQGGNNRIGSYEHDWLQTHDVDVPQNKTSQGQDGYGKLTSGGQGSEPSGIVAAAHFSGKNETMVKNVSKLGLIKI